MASVEEVTKGSYRIESRCHQVSAFSFGYVETNDLTPFFIPDGSSIERDSCSVTGHATARLNFSFPSQDVERLFNQSQVPWSSMRLRPSIRLVSTEGRGETDWVNLGVFLAETPRITSDQNPNVHAVDCFDVMTALAEPTGGTIQALAKQPINTVIEALFSFRNSFGLTLAPQVPRRFPSPPPGLLPSNRQWVIDENTTWLLIIDQLLEMVGWRPPWIDRDGFLTSDRWVSPGVLPIELELHDRFPTTVITLGSSLKNDVFGVPNNWVFIRNDIDPSIDAPSSGAGIEVRNNISAGPSSQIARGRVVSSVVRADVTDQQALSDLADRVVLQDSVPSQTLCLDIAPQPIPWHRGLIEVTIEDLGFNKERFLCRSWNLPLDGADASLVLDGLE